MLMDAVIKKVTPSKEEINLLNSITSNVLSKIRRALLDFGVAADAVIAGSFAKGTWLKGAHDIDFFIKFINEDDMRVFPKVIKFCFPKALCLKGTRDYYSINYKGYNLEFVPVLKLQSPSQAVNSMDASCFHVDYVKSRLDPELISQVRLLKQFFKAQGVYGAESYINGFSGYVTELLMLHFRTFDSFIHYLSSCAPKLFIDLEGYYPSANKAINALSSSKTQGPLILIDPVLPTRNAAASVSNHSFAKIVLASRLYKIKPSYSFFNVTTRSLKSIKLLCGKRGHYLLTKQFKVNERKDAFFSKLSRLLHKMANAFRLYGFVVYDYGFINDGTVFLELNTSLLPVSYRAMGPYPWQPGDDFNNFIKKHSKSINGPYIRGLRVCFDIKRKYTSAKQLFNYLLSIIK